MSTSCGLCHYNIIRLLPDDQLSKSRTRGNKRTSENGAIDEEYRVEYALDRANTIGQGFLAPTTGCARCHDHTHAQEGSRQFLFFRRVRQQIARDLPSRKLVERHILVERRNHPIPVRPKQAIMMIVQKTIALGIPRNVLPSMQTLCSKAGN